MDERESHQNKYAAQKHETFTGIDRRNLEECVYVRVCVRVCACVKTCVCGSDSGRGSSLLDRAIADRRQLNAMTLPDFSDPETGRRTHSHLLSVMGDMASSFLHIDAFSLVSKENVYKKSFPLFKL